MKPKVKRHPVVQPLDQSIKLIPLTKGLNAIVDAADYEWLDQWNWFASETKCGYYPRTNDGHGRKNRHQISMHTMISGYKETDHKNCNTLDNRRENLRPCTRSENVAHRKRPKQNTSGYKGVAKNGSGWRAQVQFQGKRFYLGTYATKEEAARVYREFARKTFGEFYHA